MLGVKISPNQEIEEINSENNKQFNEMDKDGYSLLVPEIWEYKKYRISFFVENYATEYNVLATALFNLLYIPNQEQNQKIYGNVYLMNEDDEKEINFTIQDLEYIKDQVKHINV
jgi:hypothetical protein